MRSYIGCFLLLTGCYSEPDFVEEFQSLYCPTLFACYESLGANCDEIQCLYPDQATCQEDWDAVYADGLGACTEDERFVAEKGEECIEKLKVFDCTQLANKVLPNACSQVCASRD